MINRFTALLFCSGAGLLFPHFLAAALPEGVRSVRVLNYPDCLQLFNDKASATIGHQVGGRVLSYQLKGKEALYLNPAEADWKTAKRPLVTAGRFDIGPEFLIPKRDVLWSGEWTPETIGPRAVRLTSRPDDGTGVQLIREFRLDPDSSHLSCRQIIRNVSARTRYWCHWSRTFARHGGVGIVPLTSDTKFPNHYVMYEGRGLINGRPKDPNIHRIGGFLVITDVPAFPKLGFDSMAGWFGYQMKHDLLFVKKYATRPDAVYNEVAGLTISIWYPKSEQVNAVELEPIGPRNAIKPGESAEFTEHWWLMENDYSKDWTEEKLGNLERRISAETRH